jgi:hypothetical protein
MKDNAHLYWPTAASEIEASTPKAQPDRRRLLPAILVERLDGGCILYRPFFRGVSL